ncbi:MAG TPA: outer membrane beta-barrel protein, partial [Chitinophaga sp.]
MRKIVLSVLLGLGAFPIHAQTSFGLLAGFNMATQRVRDNAPRVNSSYIPLWRAGVAADIPIAGGFYFQPQLLINAKGGKAASHYNVPDAPPYSDFIATQVATNKVRAVYLELPVNLLYKFTLCSGKVVAGAGPYAAIGLGGRVKSDYRFNTGPSI